MDAGPTLCIYRTVKMVQMVPPRVAPSPTTMTHYQYYNTMSWYHNNVYIEFHYNFNLYTNTARIKSKEKHESEAEERKDGEGW